MQRAGNQLVDVDSLIPAVLRNLITAAARDNQYLWCVHHNGLARVDVQRVGACTADGILLCLRTWIRGGTVGPSFDCSGLAQWAFSQKGMWIPRDAYQQYAYTDPVELAHAQPGDLVRPSAGGPPLVAWSATTAAVKQLHSLPLDTGCTQGCWEAFCGIDRDSASAGFG